jgi:hypothetical protein
MEKTMKRAIGYKPEKKSTVKIKAEPISKPVEAPKTKPAPKAPVVKMGRKPIREEDKVRQQAVFLTNQQKEILDGKYGSLTVAIKTLLVN